MNKPERHWKDSMMSMSIAHSVTTGTERTLMKWRKALNVGTSAHLGIKDWQEETQGRRKKMLSKIDEITSSGMSVSQKLRALDDFLDEVKIEIKKKEQALTDGMQYCDSCKEYYKDSAYKYEKSKEIRNVCTYWSLAEFDDPTYEDKLCIITKRTCPCGHVKETQSCI